MDEIIFYEVEDSPGESTTTYIQENNTISMEPFFLGMRIGAVCLILSLGVAVIIKLFKN